MVSFELSETQRMVQEMVHQFAEREIRPVAAKHDEEESMPWALLEKAEVLGLTMSYVGDRDRSGEGGPSAGQLNTLAAVAAEELAWGCAGITIAIYGTQFAAGVVARMGNLEQKDLFKECLRGRDDDGHVRVAAMGFTEPQAGSDVSRIATTARRDGAHWVLSGQKQFVTNGSIASVYVIWATVERAAGRAGLRAFLVPRGTPGVRPGERLRKMGIRASDTAPVYLDDCRVPAAWMMGEPRVGYGEARRILDTTRPMVAALSVGIARAALEYAVRYATEREQFGGPIAAKQGVAFLLADMAMEVEAARALAWKAAWLADRHEPNAISAAMAKAKAAGVAMDVTTKAVQILGGYGYVRDHPVEKWMRDAKVMDIFEGTGQIQRAIIAQGLTGVDCK